MWLSPWRQLDSYTDSVILVIVLYQTHEVLEFLCCSFELLPWNFTVQKTYLEFYSTIKKCFIVQKFYKLKSNTAVFSSHLFIIMIKPMWFLYSMFMYLNCDFSFGFFFFTYCILWWNSEISAIKKRMRFSWLLLVCLPYSKGFFRWRVWYHQHLDLQSCIFFFVLVKIYLYTGI